MRFSGLDWLRFVMCIFIVMQHVSDLYPARLNSVVHSFAFYSTSIFFILSGFILMHVYASKVASGQIGFRNFLGKRLGSLYGPHIVAMVATIIWAAQYYARHGKLSTPGMTMEDALSYVLQSVFLLQAWDSNWLWLNVPSWSVSALLFFYIIFYLIAPTVGAVRKILLAAVAVWLASLVLPTADFFLDRSDIGFEGLIHHNPVVRLPEFVGGMVGYAIFVRYNVFRLYRFKWYFVAVGLLSVALTSALNLSSLKWFAFLHNGLLLPLQIILIYGFSLFGLSDKHRIRKAGTFLGQAALPIYISHYAMMLWLAPVMKKFFGVPAAGDYLALPEWTFPLFVVVLMLAGLVLQKLVFKRLQNWLTPLLVNTERTRGAVA